MKNSSEVKKFISRKQKIVEQALEDFFPEKSLENSKIIEAMRYSLKGGGKRLRPVLSLAAAEVTGAETENVLPAAAALEMIHTYSLIHDDLPAMDNDDLRRGKPTSHKVFGEAQAILAGDGLLTLAFEVVAKKTTDKSLVAPLTAEIADAAGWNGMVGGQMLDIEAESLSQVAMEQLERIHEKKTGEMLRASVSVAGIAARLEPQKQLALDTFGARLGLVFQIVDDILDVTSTTEELGKTAGKDQRDSKATYPALIGLEESRKKAKEVTSKAGADLLEAFPDAKILNGIAEYMLNRIN